LQGGKFPNPIGRHLGGAGGRRVQGLPSGPVGLRVQTRAIIFRFRFFSMRCTKRGAARELLSAPFICR